MSGPVSVKCPHCDVSLKLKDESKLGKQMTCPKCKKPFKAEALDDDEAEFGALAKVSRADDGDEEEDELPPSRRPAAAPRSGSGKKKSSPSKSSGSNLPLILGGGGAVALILIGVTVFFFLKDTNPTPPPTGFRTGTGTAKPDPGGQNIASAAPSQAKPTAGQPAAVQPSAVQPSAGTPGVVPPGSNSDATVVSTVTGLPAGTVLKASAHWAKKNPFDEEDLPRPLEIDIEITGKSAESALEIGNVGLAKASAEPAQPLKLAIRASLEETDQYHGFIRIDRKSSRTAPQQKSIHAVIEFVQPADPISKVAALEGELTLRCLAEKKTIVVPDALERKANTPIDAELKAANFKLDYDNAGQSTAFQISMSNKSNVTDVALTDQNGNPLKFPVEFHRLDVLDTAVFTAMVIPGSLPKGTAVKVILPGKSEDVTLPFRFENIVVGPPPTSKGPKVAWQPSTANADLPDGIIAFGALRWNEEIRIGRKTEKDSMLLFLTVDATGGPLKHTAAIGYHKIDSATSDSGDKLTIAPNKGFFNSSGSADSFVQTSGSKLLGNMPPDGVRSDFEIEPAPPPGSKVAGVAGSLKVLVAAGTVTMTFDKITTRVGKSLSNPDLKDAGLDLKLIQDGKSMKLQVLKGNPFHLKTAKLIRESPGKERDHWLYIPSQKEGSIIVENKIAANDSLSVTIYTDCKELTIPFAFENLVVPPQPPPKKEIKF